MLNTSYFTAQTFWHTATPIDLAFKIQDLPTGQLAEAAINGYCCLLHYPQIDSPNALMRSAIRCTPAIHTQGSLRGGVPPPQRGVWGSERRALLGFAEGLARQDNPQIRVPQH